MAWKKVIVSGSDAVLNTVTASAGINIGQTSQAVDSEASVLVIDMDGNIQAIDQSTLGGTDTTYTMSIATGPDPSMVLTNDGSGGTETVTFEGGTGITVNGAGNTITITSDENNVDTTYDAGTGLTLSNATFSVDTSQTGINAVGDLEVGSLVPGFGIIDIDSNITTAGTVSASDATFSNLTVTSDTILSGNFNFNALTFTENSVMTSAGSQDWGTDAGDIHGFTGSISVTNDISASYLYGNGAGITNLNPSNINLSDLTDGDGILISDGGTYDGSAARTISVKLNGGSLSKTSAGLAIPTDGIYASHISPGAVTTAKIATDAVTHAKLDDQLISDSGVLLSTADNSDVMLISNAAGDALNRVSMQSMATYLDTAITLDTGTDTTYTLDVNNGGGIVLSENGTAVETIVTLQGASNQINVASVANSNLITVSMPTAVTLQDLTVTGTLTADTIVTINSTELTVDDQFINIGENAADGENTGIIFGANANGSGTDGVALVWNTDGQDDGRFGVAHNMSGTSQPAAIDYALVSILEGTSTAAGIAKGNHVGNIRIDASNDIFIFV